MKLQLYGAALVNSWMRQKMGVNVPKYMMC